MISIIIPVFNEEKTIGSLLDHLATHQSSSGLLHEIIVTDGGSTDRTAEIVKPHPEALWLSSKKGRAKQMNAGAGIADGKILYFLHADSFPPKNFDLLIQKEIEKGNLAGCFRMQFDSKHPFLRLMAWFTKFNHRSCRGGDQSLFVTKKLFDEIGGYDESFLIYEDNDFTNKLYRKNQFTVIQKKLTTSARRYQKNGVWRLHYHFSVIHLKKRLGASAASLFRYYEKHIRNGIS